MFTCKDTGNKSPFSSKPTSTQAPECASCASPQEHRLPGMSPPQPVLLMVLLCKMSSAGTTMWWLPHLGSIMCPHPQPRKHRNGRGTPHTPRVWGPLFQHMPRAQSAATQAQENSLPWVCCLRRGLKETRKGKTQLENNHQEPDLTYKEAWEKPHQGLRNCFSHLLSLFPTQ